MIEFGIDATEFRERYFEKQPHVFTAALREQPIGWPDLDELLYRIEPIPGGLQLFHHGAVPPENYVQESVELGQRRRRLSKIRFYGYMRNGATLVINRLETHFASARAMCVEVGRFTGHPTSGNAYLSFSGDGTFGKHWDTHDVFAIQLLGRKRWQVFQPTLPLPLSHQTSERSEIPCPATPVLDRVLETGDVLYVPRGWWHQVLPLEEGSFHLSVGTYAPTMQDYTGWICSQVLPQLIEGRRALENTSQDQMNVLVEHLRTALLNPQLQADFQRSIAVRETVASAFNLDLFLNRQVPLLDASARLRLNTRAVPDKEGRMIVNGAVVQLDAAAAMVMSLLSSHGTKAFGALLRELPTIPAQAVHRAVLDLIGREVVAVQP